MSQGKRSPEAPGLQLVGPPSARVRGIPDIDVQIELAFGQGNAHIVKAHIADFSQGCVAALPKQKNKREKTEGQP